MVRPYEGRALHRTLEQGDQLKTLRLTLVRLRDSYTVLMNANMYMTLWIIFLGNDFTPILHE